MQATRSHQPVLNEAPTRHAASPWLPLIVFVVPYLFIWQGLDFTDKGLMLAYADQMFRQPNVYGSMSSIWLTGALAHLWLYVVPLPPVLALNVLFAVLLNALSLVAYVALRKRFEHKALWSAILLSLLFTIPPLQNGFGYQALSMALLSVAAFALVNGLVEYKIGWVIWSGVAAGVSVFVRLPNVLGIGLIAVPVLHAFFANKKVNAKVIGGFIVGYIIGIALVLLVIAFTKQLDVFKSGIVQLFASSNERYEAGSPQGLLSTYLRDAWKMLLYAVVGGLISLPIIFVANFFLTPQRSIVVRKTAWWGIAIAAVLCGLALLMKFDAVFVLKDVQRYLLCGVVLAVAVFLTTRFRDSILRTLIGAGLIACVSCFAGSDVGFSSYAVFPVLLPMVAFALNRPSGDRAMNVSVWLRTAVVFWLMFVVSVSVGLCVSYVYRDAPRSALTYTVRNEPKLAGVFTSNERRDAIEELLEATHRHVKPNAILWATPDLPMVYYLTSTKPFTQHPWDNLFNAPTYEQRVRRFERQALPTAVIHANGTTRNPNWPANVTQSNEPDRAQKEKTVSDFLSRHRFVKVWENGFFELWLLPDDVDR